MNKMQILSSATQRFASSKAVTPKVLNPRPSLPGVSRRGVSVRAGEGRQPWDFGRFVSTVAFFNEGNLQKTLQSAVDNLAKAISGGSQEQTVKELPLGRSTQTMDPLNPVIPVPVDGIIMVTGATGGVGKRVVAKILQAGKHVRALVRDAPKAQELLSSLPAGPGGKLEVVVADITQRRTLLPEYFRGVRAVVSCTAVKVQPKEGDDSQRSKYMQGIKFFDPEIVGDTPETVELLGMRNLLEAVENSLGPAQGIQILKASLTLPNGSRPRGALWEQAQRKLTRPFCGVLRSNFSRPP
ncbi:hypothetical protein DUNSADRAFT_18603 [Dunaliella salina]|uniref:NAD(P)-binding domain-containing protein n=1 Tax=Dunaliella salina TaxID=3046 RepID=A0ABQ7FZU0_DUNSA|nr:hypothetical protein DUNSADRAFT_18603 [Dunaliella salina]|eukprot:KAF5827867.1 hypothetical protein DUNSADRAFT_18603 [Dunaliella salina]